MQRDDKFFEFVGFVDGKISALTNTGAEFSVVSGYLAATALEIIRDL